MPMHFWKMKANGVITEQVEWKKLIIANNF